MSTIKTKIDESEVYMFLKEYYNQEILDFQKITWWEVSQAFSYIIKNNEYVVRINKTRQWFDKDKYAYDNFSSKWIPVPKILSIWKLNNQYHYSISEKVRWKNMANMSQQENEKLMPMLFEVLNNIHNISIENTENYWDWDKQWNATAKSWEEHILSIENNRSNGWNDLFEKTIMEKDIFNVIIKQIKEFIRYCPEDRYLIHWDYWFDNAFTDWDHVIWIIDWELSKYWDFLYDIAWLDFRWKEIWFAKYYEKYLRDYKISTQNYCERVYCYQFEIWLWALKFYAMSQQPNSYEHAKWILSDILKKI